MKTHCSDCKRSLNADLNPYYTCLICDASQCLSCKPCDCVCPRCTLSYSVCECEPDENSGHFASLLHAHMEAKGLSLDDLAFLMSDKATVIQ